MKDYPIGLIFILVFAFANAVINWRRNRSRTSFYALFFIFAIIFFAETGWRIWRNGKVVAQAEFNPGIAPFTLTVRRVPVPVTNSKHFIVSLRRGEYPVTSFRYFWDDYTPSTVKINWQQLRSFTVTFDDVYVASCTWDWGREATWTMTGPPQGKVAGERL